MTQPLKHTSNDNVPNHNSDRDRKIQSFLTEHGFGEASRQAISGDASFRNYQRIWNGDKSVILMDAPPPHEDVKPFVHIAEFLTRHGLSAPKILARDVEEGFLLLEDFGDASYNKILRGESDLENVPGEQELYGQAVDALVALHRSGVPAPLKRYDHALLMDHVLRYSEWYLPYILRSDEAEDIAAEYHAVWQALLASWKPLKEVLILFDYHADNLMWLPEHKGIKQVGLLDFQDALLGDASYDLVSLLEDARRTVSESLQQAMIARYLAQMTDVKEADFRAAYAMMGAQRNLRIIGTFARLAVRDKKPHYLHFLPRVWGHLERDIEHPILAPLKKHLDKTVPNEMRTLVPILA